MKQEYRLQNSGQKIDTCPAQGRREGVWTGGGGGVWRVKLPSDVSQIFRLF